MLISGFMFVGCEFCFLVLDSSLEFQRVLVECCLFYWPVQLVCSREDAWVDGLRDPKEA